jgi:hypothetical protein
LAAAADGYRPATVRRHRGGAGEDVQRSSRRVGRDSSEAIAVTEDSLNSVRHHNTITVELVEPDDMPKSTSLAESQVTQSPVL